MILVQESGITEPISGGEVRDKQDQYKGMGIEKVPCLDFALFDSALISLGSI